MKNTAKTPPRMGLRGSLKPTPKFIRRKPTHPSAAGYLRRRLATKVLTSVFLSF